MKSRLRVWERWQRAAGPWQGWMQCPALLAPGGASIAPRRDPRPAAARIATALAETLASAGALLILELDPVLGVEVAARLNERRQANCVLVLPRWPYERAILPVDSLLYALQTHARRLTESNEHLPNVAFVLDAERSLAVPRRSPRDRRADNRYHLVLADLPDLAGLRARGIRRLVRLAPVR